MVIEVPCLVPEVGSRRMELVLLPIQLYPSGMADNGSLGFSFLITQALVTQAHSILISYTLCYLTWGNNSELSHSRKYFLFKGRY